VPSPASCPYRMYKRLKKLPLHWSLAVLLFIPVTAVPVSARRKGY
jgi:hypothetical protein